LSIDVASLGAPIFAEEFTAPLSVWDAAGNPGGRWRNDYGYGGQADYKFNDELQYYTGPYFGAHHGDFDDGNYAVADGVLTISAHRTDNPEILAQHIDYTSGLITTRGLEPWFGGPTDQFAFEYGYVEMRADLSDEPGAWNALWLLPADYSYAEADVVEAVGREGGQVWLAVHGAADQGQYAPGVNVAGDGFHTFGLAWTPETLTWYVDGVATWTRATPSDMHQPMVLLANLAVGGSWAGAPDFGADGAAQMKIDYIRAYALPGVTGDSAGSATAGLGDEWRVQTGAGTADSLQGGESQDYISGGDGDDRIDGGGAFDALNGNPGRDTVGGGAGSDWVLGGKDDDQLAGDDGDDMLNGNLGNDTADGGAGADVVRGGQGDDSLFGGVGDDWISGDRGSDTLSGGPGADAFHIFGGSGADVAVDFDPAQGDHVLVEAGTVYALTQAADGALVILSTGDSLLLKGLAAASLSDGWLLTL
jgi:beta-glucanase (GH16 family)